MNYSSRAALDGGGIKNRRSKMISRTLWKKDYRLNPKPYSEAMVWRAASQLLKEYPNDTARFTALAAEEANEHGDKFNCVLWTRVHKAVLKLLQNKPGRSDTIH
jgi:hypothetical protein